MRKVQMKTPNRGRNLNDNILLPLLHVKDYIYWGQQQQNNGHLTFQLQ